MPVLICDYCGSVFVGRARAKFCNTDCYRKSAKEAAVRRALSPEVAVYANACRFNEGVDCLQQEECSRCGWNPEVAERRFTQILARLLGVEVKTDGD